MMGFLGPRFWGLDNPGLAGPHSSRPSTHSRRPRFAIAPGPAPPAAFQRLGGAARTRERERAGGGPNGGAAPRPRGLGGAWASGARTAAPLGPMGNAGRARACGGRGAGAGGSGSVLGAVPSPCARPATRGPARGTRPAASAETVETRRVDPRWPPRAARSPRELLCLRAEVTHTEPRRPVQDLMASSGPAEPCVVTKQRGPARF